MSQYDFVIVGAGFSGVMLASRLLADPGLTGSHAREPRILVLDRSLTGRGRTTFAFWSQHPTVLDRWELASWRRLRVIGHDERIRTLALDGWRYRAVSWDTARAELLQRLADDPRVTMVEAAVDEVRDGPDLARVRVGEGWVSGRFVFDSRPRRTGGEQVAPRRALTLYQSFHGIWVRSQDCEVHVSAATLLDFSADDGPDLGFAYVLPVEPHSAMVMAVRMGPGTDLPDPAPAVPRELGQDGWEVVGHERGVTALVTPAPARREGARVLAIGGRGGRVRASTGYAVTRIIADTEMIAASLRDRGHPFAIPADPRRDNLLDAIWLHALAANRAALEPAFLALFAGVPIGAVLRFLDGRSNLSDLLRVVRALPPGPFLRAAAHLALGTGPGTP